MGFEYEDIALAKQTNDPTVLLDLAGSAFATVRESVARNIHADAAVLGLLENDSDPKIAETARLRISSTHNEVSELIDDYVPAFNLDDPLTIPFSTLQNDPSIKVKRSLGLVYGTSSKIAFGLNNQAQRLDMAMHLALLDVQHSARTLGGNAVVAVSIAVNSSRGGVEFFGNSDGIVVTGTAVIADMD